MVSERKRLCWIQLSFRESFDLPRRMPLQSLSILPIAEEVFEGAGATEGCETHNWLWRTVSLLGLSHFEMA